MHSPIGALSGNQPLTQLQHNFEVFLVIALGERLGPMIGRFTGAKVSPVAPDGGQVKVPLEVRTLLRGLRHRVQFTMEGPRPPGYEWAQFLWGFVQYQEQPHPHGC